jgi:hypothetical protein
MWPSSKASGVVLQGAEDSSVVPQTGYFICTHLCPWGLLGGLNDRAD